MAMRGAAQKCHQQPTEGDHAALLDRLQRQRPHIASLTCWVSQHYSETHIKHVPASKHARTSSSALCITCYCHALYLLPDIIDAAPRHSIAVRNLSRMSWPLNARSPYPAGPHTASRDVASVGNVHRRVLLLKLARWKLSRADREMRGEVVFMPLQSRLFLLWDFRSCAFKPKHSIKQHIFYFFLRDEKQSGQHFQPAIWNQMSWKNFLETYSTWSLQSI